MTKRLTWIVGIGVALMVVAGGALWWSQNRLALQATETVRDLLDMGDAKDIGLDPKLRDGEVADREHCRSAASNWLASAQSDPDLARDTRVAIPIVYEPSRNVTRVWATLGVRLTRLNATYVRPPRIRPAEGAKEWETVPERLRLGSSYVIAVDEFAEVELQGAHALNRKELRALRDRWRTKEAIVEAMGK
jgi:hypothetical protein